MSPRGVLIFHTLEKMELVASGFARELHLTNTEHTVPLTKLTNILFRYTM